MSAGHFVRATKAEDLLCTVSYRGPEGGQATIRNNHRGLMDWDREYVEFSGYFGSHGPDVFAAAPELLAVCEGMIPRNVCLTNPNVRDDAVVSLDVTMGTLRKIAAAIAKATGAA